jgi:hypothetical protein
MRCTRFVTSLYERNYMNPDQAHLHGTQISMPLIEGLAEKLDFNVRNIFNFTIMPMDDRVVFGWNEHAEDGSHPLLMEVLDYDEFNDIAEAALQAVRDSGVVSEQTMTNAMSHVDILDELGATMQQYPLVAGYLNQYYPGFLEFPDEETREVLEEALSHVRDGWVPQ